MTANNVGVASKHPPPHLPPPVIHLLSDYHKNWRLTACDSQHETQRQMSQVIVVGSQEALCNFNDDFHQASQSPVDSKRGCRVALRVAFFQPKYAIQDSKLYERGSQKTYWSMARSHLELLYTTAPQITQMEVVSQSELTVSTIDALSLHWPKESKSINKAGDIIFQSLHLPPLSVCTHWQPAALLCFSFFLPGLVLRTIYSEVYRLQLLLASLSLLTCRQCVLFQLHSPSTLAQRLFSSPFPATKSFSMGLACPTVSHYPQLPQPYMCSIMKKQLICECFFFLYAWLPASPKNIILCPVPQAVKNSSRSCQATQRKVRIRGRWQYRVWVRGNGKVKEANALWGSSSFWTQWKKCIIIFKNPPKSMVPT